MPDASRQETCQDEHIEPSLTILTTPVTTGVDAEGTKPEIERGD
jgi:hypothetical protein